MAGRVIKIHQGTGQLTGESLCLSCSRGYVRHDSRGETRYCRYFEQYLRADVQKCSEYYNSALPSLNDMHQIAWTLLTDKAKKIGFKPPKASGHAPDDWMD